MMRRLIQRPKISTESTLKSLAIAVFVIAGSTLVGCSSNAESTAGATVVDVVSTDDSCTLSDTAAPAGKIVFNVRNDGTKVTEFYLYADGGASVVGEVENIGPGVSRKMTVSPGAGAYLSACKPGETGDGIRAAFTVE